MHVDFQGSCWICYPSVTCCAASCSVTDSQTLLVCVWQLWSRQHPSLGLCLSLLHWNDIFRQPKCAVISSTWTSDGRISFWFKRSEHTTKHLSLVLLLLFHVQNILLQWLYSICVLLLRRFWKILQMYSAFQRQPHSVLNLWTVFSLR